MTQNFDPVGLATDVARLGKELSDIKHMFSGDAKFQVSELLEAVNAALEVAANFVPRLQELERIIAPFIPLIPLLEKQLAGEVAGEGATLTASVTIPADQLGKFSDAPVVLESRVAVETNPSEPNNA